jgi:hypothetical protein
MSLELAHTPATPAPAASAAGRAALKNCAACDTFKPLKDFRHANNSAPALKTCAGCRSRIAERRRERKDEERGELRSRALDLAQALFFLADLHPDYRLELDRLASRIQRHGHRRRDSAVEAVTKAIRVHACHTVADIVDETRMPASDVRRVLAAMHACGRVESTTQLRGGAEIEWWDLADGAPSSARP